MVVYVLLSSVSYYLINVPKLLFLFLHRHNENKKRKAQEKSGDGSISTVLEEDEELGRTGSSNEDGLQSLLDNVEDFGKQRW